MTVPLTLALLACLGSSPNDRIETYLEEQRKAKNVQGLAYAVLREGRIVKIGALGLANVEWGLPATVDTAFEIGSVTKQFTATLIMTLKEEGRLALDDPLSKHLPEVPAAWKDVRLRHLLTHTSGLKNLNALPGFELTEKLDRKRFIERLSPPPPEFAVGEKYQYGNTNYALLGFVVEAVTGESYWDNLKKRIFEPLGMKRSGNRDPLSVYPRRAAGYDFVNGRVVNRDYDLTDVFSAGAIVSTIEDMANWESFLHFTSRVQGTRGAALDAMADEFSRRGLAFRPVLTRTSLLEMWIPNKLNSGEATNYGLGFRIDTVKGRRVVGHGGSTSGFSSTIQRWPDQGLSIIVLTNAETLGVATDLARGLADVLLGG